MELNKNPEALKYLLEKKLITEEEYQYLFKKRSSNNDFLNKNFKRNSNLQPILEVSNLTKHYNKRPQPAINNVSFKVFPGDFHAFVGANGAGKTTTIKAIIGAYSNKKYNGKILIDGKINSSIDAKKLIGYIPEVAIFPKKLKTKEYLISMAILSGFSKSKATQLVDDLLIKTNMKKLANKRPMSFSSGQKKKVLLIQALIHDPKILIMDEPAANLDTIARMELFNLLVELQKEGKAIFISSHILDEIGKYTTSTTILDGGKVVFDGEINQNNTLSELFAQYVKIGSVDNNF
ncbi:MAG: ABC transporter ATP-binding protein [Metamycoplasmataceae bacterium]